MRPGDRGETSFFGLAIARLCFEFASQWTVEQITNSKNRLPRTHPGDLVFLPDGLDIPVHETLRSSAKTTPCMSGRLIPGTVTRLMPVQSIVRYIRSGIGEPERTSWHVSLPRRRIGGTAISILDTQEDCPAIQCRSSTMSATTPRDWAFPLMRIRRWTGRRPPSFGAGHTRLTWFDRSGELTGTLGEPREYLQPRISPDGARVAFTRPDAQTRQSRHLVRGSRPCSLLPPHD